MCVLFVCMRACAFFGIVCAFESGAHLESHRGVSCPKAWVMLVFCLRKLTFAKKSPQLRAASTSRRPPADAVHTTDLSHAHRVVGVGTAVRASPAQALMWARGSSCGGGGGGRGAVRGGGGRGCGGEGRLAIPRVFVQSVASQRRRVPGPVQECRILQAVQKSSLCKNIERERDPSHL